MALVGNLAFQNWVFWSVQPEYLHPEQAYEGKELLKSFYT